MTTITPATSTSLIDYYKDQVAQARLRSGAPAVTNPTNSSASSTRQTANTAILNMATLLGQVTTLSRRAGNVQESNPQAMDLLRSGVALALTKFNDIAKAAGMSTSPASTTDTSTTPATTAKAPTLAELRTELSNMQANLHDNIGKLGSSVQKSFAYGGSATPSSSLADLWTAFSARQAAKTSYFA